VHTQQSTLNRTKSVQIPAFRDVKQCKLVEVNGHCEDTCSLITKGAGSSETSLHFYQPTRRHIPEDNT